MAAGTEGYVDTRGSVNPIASVISKILAARQMAEEERQYASDIAEANQTSLEEAGIEKGFFFKKALAHEFGGDYIGSKKEDLNNLVERAKLLKNPRQNFWQLFKKQKKSTKLQRFKANFDYAVEIDDPMTRPMSPVTGGSARKVQKATRGSGKRISKEQLLESLNSLVGSLQSISSSLNETTSQSSKSINAVAESQLQLAEQLKTRTDTLEDKLDKIAAAISKQTQFQKVSIDKAEDVEHEKSLDKVTDTATVSGFDDLSTKENELARPTGFEHIALPGNIPEAETGAILSGPDSGYLAKLHGDEMVVPLNNNYTQGQPSAMDGKVRPKPYQSRRQSFEIGSKPVPGVSAASPMGTGIVNLGGSTNQFMNESLVRAMELPMKAVGGAVISSTSKYIGALGGQAGGLDNDLQSLIRPVAAVFGLPPSFAKSAAGTGAKEAEVPAPVEKKDEGRGGILAKMLETFETVLKGLADTINESNPPGPGPGPDGDLLIPGDAPPEIKALMETISGGEGGPNSVNNVGEVKGLSDMTIDQAISKGLELKEQGLSSGALGAYQFMPQYLKERAEKAGLDTSKDKFSMENQTKIMRTFMVGLYGQTEATMVRHLKEGKLESHIFPKLAKDSGWPSLPGGSQPNVHTPHAAKRYEAKLKKYQQIAASPAAPPPSAGIDPAKTEARVESLKKFLSSSKPGDGTSFQIPELGVSYVRGKDLFGKQVDKLISTRDGKTLIFSGSSQAVRQKITELLEKKGLPSINPPTPKPEKNPETASARAEMLKPDAKTGNGSTAIAMLNTNGSPVTDTSTPPGADNLAIDRGVPDRSYRDFYPNKAIG